MGYYCVVIVQYILFHLVPTYVYMYMVRLKSASHKSRDLQQKQQQAEAGATVQSRPKSQNERGVKIC